MSQPGVFICPSCQAVVRSEQDTSDGLVCGECGFQFGEAGAPKVQSLPQGSRFSESKGVVRNLTAKKAAIVRVPKSGQAPPIVAKPYEEVVVDEQPEREGGEVLLPDGSKKIRKRRKKTKREKNKPMVFFLLGWVCIVVLVFVLFFTRNSEDSDRDDDREVDVTETRDREFVAAHQDELFRLFNEYVFAPTMKGREQFIGRSSEMALPFSRYYREHSFSVPAAPIKVVGANVIEVSKDPLVLAIEQVWVDAEGRLFGTTHYFDGQGWKLDWESYAPYSEMSWARFLADLGGQEGEFRLLVRKRKSRDESKRFVLSFYRPPVFTEPEKEFLKSESPEVEVETDSELGKEFLRLWSEFNDGKFPLDSMLSSLDPEGFMRITVRMGLEESELRGLKRVVLKEIIGPGWFGGFIREKHEADKARLVPEVEAGEGDDKAESGENL